MMFKKYALFIAMSILSINAFAELHQTTDAAVDTYAAEIFGDASVSVVTKMEVTLTLVDVGISSGNTASITYTLQDGATFASQVSLADFHTTSTTSTFSLTLLDGGQIGDSYITITATTVIDAPAGADIIFINPADSYCCPEIDNIDYMATIDETIDIIITVTPTTSSGTNPWPTSVTNTNTTLATSILGYTIDLAESTDVVDINISDRTVLSGDDVVDVDHDNDSATDDIASAKIAGFSLALVGSALDAAGLAFEPANGSSGNGVLNFTVEGDFNTGDALCLTGTGTAGCALGTISGNTATYTMDIAELSDVSIYYVPSAGATLSASTFDTTIEVVYDTETHVTGFYDLSTSFDIAFTGLTADGSASAIPGSQSADSAFIRITNLGGSSITLFGTAYAQAGDELGFVQMDDLAAYETRVYTQTDIEDFFGTWTGRARIEFMVETGGDISVQTMVRSGGILQNITGSTGDYDNK